MDPASSSAEASASQKKRKRVDLSQFADLEAEEVGGSGEEEDEYIDEEFIDDGAAKDSDATKSKLRKKMNLDKELKEIERDMASRGPLRGAARIFSSARLDEMEMRFKEMDEAAKRGEDISKMEVLESVQQTVTVPEAKDPRLWCLKTFGPEQELCIKLMWKAFETIRSGESVPVSSVFTVPYVRNYIYLEAHREADVRRFTKGINGLSQYTGLSLVPIDQMAGVFSAAMSAAQKVNLIRPGDYVRFKKGPYRGDLAQVDEVDDENYLLKIKPRIRGGQIAKGSKKIFPPKWFNKDDMEATGEVLVQVEPRKTQKGFKLFYVVHGEAFRDGFLYKNFRSSAFLSGSDVRPTEYELTDWKNAPPISEQVRPLKDELLQSKEEEDRDPMPPPPPVKKDTGPVLQDGEHVIVHSGDLRNLRGVVTKAVFGSPTVLIQPRDVDVKGDLSISTTRLCKYFEIGDYVTVLDGDHAGDAGHVEQVELGPGNSWGSHATARILTSNYTSFRAALNDLRRSLERPETRQSSGEFRVGQFVMVKGQETRAIIIRLEAGDRAMVLGSDGKKYVTLAELQPLQIPPRRLYKQQTWCEDKKRHRLVPGCVVKAPQSYTGSAPVNCEVLYIYQGWVFLRAIEGLVGERAYLVAPGDRCEYVWDPDDMPKGKGRGRNTVKAVMPIPDKSEQELSSKPMSFGIKMASQISFLKSGWHKMLGLTERPAGAPTGGVMVTGSNVKITGGSYKGLRGEIRDFLEDRVRISLLSAPKLVEISINDVQEDLYCKEKAERKFVDSYTPAAAPMPVPKEEKSMEQNIAEGTERVGMPSDDQAWDPTWLTGDGVSAPSAPLTPAVSIVSSSRRRRGPRLSAEVLAETQVPATGP